MPLVAASFVFDGLNLYPCCGSLTAWPWYIRVEPSEASGGTVEVGELCLEWCGQSGSSMIVSVRLGKDVMVLDDFDTR